MKKIKKYIAVLFAGITLYTSAVAQDFYNGCRGPRAFQIDVHANYSNGKASGMIVPKIFTKNLERSLPNILLAIPNAVSEKGIVTNKGFNLGYIVEKENLSVIGALGLFTDDSEKYHLLNPQIYFTYMRDAWTFDAEGNVSINLKTCERGEFASATVGYGVNKWLRIGGSFIKERGKNVNYNANMRVELTSDHQYWMQCYIGKKNLEARLSINL